MVMRVSGREGTEMLLLPLPLLCGSGWCGDDFSGRVRAGVVTDGRRLQWVTAGGGSSGGGSSGGGSGGSVTHGRRPRGGWCGMCVFADCCAVAVMCVCRSSYC